MKERKRAHRKDPVRTGPIRDFANLYRSSDGTGTDANSAKRSRTQRPNAAAQSDGVGLAYQVIEKYINAGRSAAAQLSTQPHGLGPVTRPLQEVIDRILRYQAEMLPLWLDLFGSLGRADAFRMGNSPVAPVSMSNGGPPHQHQSVTIEVASRRAFEVSIDLVPQFANMPLVTAGLHALEKNKPGLTAVNFTPGNARRRAKWSIRIPDHQPPGLYSGVVIDPSSKQARGTMSVRVGKKFSP